MIHQQQQKDTDDAGNCLVDTDGDGVCDADEVVGCQDASAFNYSADATDAGSCNIPVGCDTCDGDNVVNTVLMANTDDGFVPMK